MSIRTAVHRLVQNGRVVLRLLRNNDHFQSRGYTNKHLDKIHVAQIGKLYLAFVAINFTMKFDDIAMITVALYNAI